MKDRKYKPGTKLNYLTILKYTQGRPPIVLVRCDCGIEKEVSLSSIVPVPNARRTMSCGCKRSELVLKKITRHGMSRTKFHRHWGSMIYRVDNKNYARRKSYEGITVEPRWRVFENFKDDMYKSFLIHDKKHGGNQTTLDRIDNNGNYTRDNCRWATQKEQANNRGRVIHSDMIQNNK